MICDNCKIDRLVTDFIKNKKYCYHCEYQLKLEQSSGKQIQKTNFCRVCGKAVAHIENLKKRQRSVFCSLNCAKKGHKHLINNHWTRQVRSGRFS
jgi:hypothetical protein